MSRGSLSACRKSKLHKRCKESAIEPGGGGGMGTGLDINGALSSLHDWANGELKDAPRIIFGS